jgi:hypothetical protein
MPKVVYIGTSNFREIYKKDWESVGVSDQDKVTWDRDSGVAVDISESAWEYLQRVEKGDYKEVLEESVKKVSKP